MNKKWLPLVLAVVLTCGLTRSVGAVPHPTRNFPDPCVAQRGLLNEGDVTWGPAYDGLVWVANDGELVLQLEDGRVVSSYRWGRGRSSDANYVLTVQEETDTQIGIIWVIASEPRPNG